MSSPATYSMGFSGAAEASTRGGFVPRPPRPARHWRNGNYLGAFPARTLKKHKPVVAAVHAAFSAEIRKIPPESR